MPSGAFSGSHSTDFPTPGSARASSSKGNVSVAATAGSSTVSSLTSSSSSSVGNERPAFGLPSTSSAAASYASASSLPALPYSSSSSSQAPSTHFGSTVAPEQTGDIEMAAPAGASLFESLPDEALLRIWSFLDAPSIGRCGEGLSNLLARLRFSLLFR